jgi:hypothetical protein
VGFEAVKLAEMLVGFLELAVGLLELLGALFDALVEFAVDGAEVCKCILEAA